MLKTTLTLMLLLSAKVVAQDLFDAGADPAFDAPYGSPGLAGANLKSIRSSARWAFGKDQFELTFRRDRVHGHGFTDDDRKLAKRLTNSEVFPPKRIVGRWKVSGKQLLLTGLRSNGQRLPDARFPFEAAGEVRANIGGMQYHVDEFGGSFAGSYVSSTTGARLVISPARSKLEDVPTSMTLVPAPHETRIKGPLVDKLTNADTVRTLTWRWKYYRDQRLSFVRISANAEPPSAKGKIVVVKQGDAPKSLSIGGEMFVLEPEPALPFRLVTYNVWYGFTKVPQRKRKWLRWVENKVPDVVVLQELNTYTGKQLEEDASSWGHDHSVLLKEDGFPTGITSQTPITDVKRFRDGFHHGLMRVQIAGYYIYVVHLHPSNWEVRIRETKLLLEDAKTLPADARIIIAGDFNTFSPLDAKHYATLDDLEPFFGRLDERAKGRAKNLRDGKLDYTPMTLFAEAGFIDQEARFRFDFDGTFPTKIPKKGEHGDLRRLDYVLTSPNISSHVKAAWSESDSTTHLLSDHYPVIMDVRHDPDR